MEPSPNAAAAPACDGALSATLLRLAAEIAAAQEAALDLQLTVTALVSAPEPARASAIFELQRLDWLSQVLGDLACFARSMATGAEEGAVDAAAAAAPLKLADVARRLAGGSPCPPPPVTDGDIHLFPTADSHSERCVRRR